ncbi:MAG: DUF465 domain-containing protein [Pseudomonadota bacterium]
MALDARLEQLGARHRQLDLTIRDEERRPALDTLQIAELKREKLRLKDQIEALRPMARAVD